MCGDGVMWEICVPSPQFCCEPVTALKTLSPNKKKKLQKEQPKPTSN